MASLIEVEPPQESMLRHMAAGAWAGIAEHSAVFPIDTVKTHLQSEAAGHKTAAGSLRLIMKENGFWALWRGLPSVAAACIPAHALMFASYEEILQLGGVRSPNPSPERVAVVGALAGGLSTILHDSVMVPADVVKQRMQLGHYTGAWDCLRRQLSTSLYRSLPTTLAMNIPYARPPHTRRGPSPPQPIQGEFTRTHTPRTPRTGTRRS